MYSCPSPVRMRVTEGSMQSNQTSTLVTIRRGPTVNRVCSSKSFAIDGPQRVHEIGSSWWLRTSDVVQLRRWEARSVASTQHTRTNYQGEFPYIYVRREDSANSHTHIHSTITERRETSAFGVEITSSVRIANSLRSTMNIYSRPRLSRTYPASASRKRHHIQRSR